MNSVATVPKPDPRDPARSCLCSVPPLRSSPIDPAATRGTQSARYHHHEVRADDRSRSPPARQTAPSAPIRQRSPARPGSPVAPPASSQPGRSGCTAPRSRPHPVGPSTARTRVPRMACQPRRAAPRPARARTPGASVAASQPASTLMLTRALRGRLRTIPCTGMLRSWHRGRLSRSAGSPRPLSERTGQHPRRDPQPGAPANSRHARARGPEA